MTCSEITTGFWTGISDRTWQVEVCWVVHLTDLGKTTIRYRWVRRGLADDFPRDWKSQTLIDSERWPYLPCDDPNPYVIEEESLV